MWGHPRVYVWFVHSVIDDFETILGTVEDKRLFKRGKGNDPTGHFEN